MPRSRAKPASPRSTGTKITTSHNAEAPRWRTLHVRRADRPGGLSRSLLRNNIPLRSDNLRLLAIGLRTHILAFAFNLRRRWRQVRRHDLRLFFQLSSRD